MKYINFKRFKFSTIFKNINFKRYVRIPAHVAEFVIFIIKYVFSRIYKGFNFIRHHFLKTYSNIDFKRYKFSTIVKKFNTLGNNFLKIFKLIDFKKYDLIKIYKYPGIRSFSFTKIIKYFDLKIYNISRLKKINFISSKFLLFHFPAAVIFFGFLYLSMPTFYNYDKSKIESIICKNNNIECLIKGDVNYRFYPTPRVKIKNLTINGFLEKKHTLITVEDVSIKLSFKNLLAKEKHKFTKIELNNFKTNLDLKNFKRYKNILKKEINLVPITFKKGQIVFYDGDNYVTSIDDANIKAKFIKGYVGFELKGKFLNDNIYVNLDSKNADNKISTDLILKVSNLNLLTKANFFSSADDKNKTSGNFLVKKDKNKIAGIFDYKDNELTINKSNLSNTFVDGGLEGKIIFLPYFDFNLDFNLNSINFTRLYNYFLGLDEKEQKDLFKISNKINGKLNFSVDKVYSKHNLVKSLESRVKFYNGNVDIEQFLINLGKLGAADILGTIHNNKKLSNLKFESNVFIDNQKKFLSKLGIYNKKNVSSNLFISANLDLENIRLSFYEITDDEKFNTEDINYIESEFNDLMLEDGFKYLFDFPKFKVFLKSVADEKN